MSAASTIRTITLTDRPPVRIGTAHWPIIASASGDDGPTDHNKHEQSIAHGECRRWILHVRQHADGRTLVYAVIFRRLTDHGTASDAQDDQQMSVVRDLVHSVATGGAR